MNPWNAWNAALLSVTLGTMLAGCGGAKYSGPKRYPVAGDVTYEGQTVDIGSISFTPAEGEGRPAGATIVDGKYTIPEEQGPNAGKYQVQIHWLKQTGRKLKDAESGEMYDERKEALSDKAQTNGGQTVEIPAPKNRHDFNLQSK